MGRNSAKTPIKCTFLGVFLPYTRSWGKPPFLGLKWPFFGPFWPPGAPPGGDPPPGGSGRRGRSTFGLVGILHFGVRMVILLCVYAHSVQVPVKRPRDSHLSDLSQVTLQVPLGSCTGDFICGGHLDPNAPTRRRWLEGNFAPWRI